MRLASSEFDRITTFLVEYFGIRSVWDVFRIIIDILMISYVFYPVSYTHLTLPTTPYV